MIVTLTGTDLYQLMATDPRVLDSIERAARLVVLHPGAIRQLPDAFRSKARVVYQSAASPLGQSAASPTKQSAASPTKQSADSPPGGDDVPADYFDILVIAHLRDIKDPFRAAAAARLLPAASRIRIVHLGGAFTAADELRAREEQRSNDRYLWLGARSRRQTLERLLRSRLLAQTSIAEGGANVISESIVCDIPVVGTRIDGVTGLFGTDYPGLFDVSDTAALAALLSRCETDTAFLADLARRCRELRTLFDPAREKAAWTTVLSDLKRAPAT